jgi:hypothetical protein
MLERIVKSSSEKMRDYRTRLRASGLRPIQIWIPDVRAQNFDTKLRRQIESLDQKHEEEVLDFIESAVGALDGR